MRRVLFALVVLLSALPALAQEADAGGSAWSFSAEAYGYFVPQEGDYLTPLLRADHEGGLHLEARYNYEALGAGSLWAGWTFEGGETLEWSLTPMVAFVSGDLEGAAAGFEATLGWREVEFYSESEYVADSAEGGQDFFYSWNELSVSAGEWLRVGGVGQYTRTMGGEGEFAPGVLVALAVGRAEVGFYAFGKEGDPTLMVSLCVEF